MHEVGRNEWLWRLLRRAVTHTHRREPLDPLLADANAWARDLSPAGILSQIGSPFASQPDTPQHLDLAA